MKKARVTRLLRRGVSFTLYAQEIKNGDPLLAGEAAPEHQPGEFVGIINELADQWAADWDVAPKKPIHRHLKVICQGDD